MFACLCVYLIESTCPEPFGTRLIPQFCAESSGEELEMAPSPEEERKMMAAEQHRMRLVNVAEAAERLRQAEAAEAAARDEAGARYLAAVTRHNAGRAPQKVGRRSRSRSR